MWKGELHSMQLEYSEAKSFPKKVNFGTVSRARSWPFHEGLEQQAVYLFHACCTVSQPSGFAVTIASCVVCWV